MYIPLDSFDYVLICLSNNLLSLAEPVLENLDRESVTVLVKNINSKGVTRILEYLANHLESKASKKSFYYMFFLNQLIIYKFAEIKEMKNNFSNQ